MAKAPQRAPPQETAASDQRTPLERMTDLTRAIIHVPKSEVVSHKKKSGRRRKR